MGMFLEDFNEKLAEKEFQTPIPGDTDFDEVTMLQDKYLVSADATLCLFAPTSASYEWKIYEIRKTVLYSEYNIVQTDYVQMTIPGYIPTSTKELYLYIPDVEDQMKPGTYKLELTVTDDLGAVYRDVAALVVYEPFYDLNKDSEGQSYGKYQNLD